jgi:hypothetical protein
MSNSLIFSGLYGLLVLNNVVYILHLANRYGVWAFLHLCDCMLVLFSFLFMRNYDLWVCDVDVSFVVLGNRPFVFLLCLLVYAWPFCAGCYARHGHNTLHKMSGRECLVLWVFAAQCFGGVMCIVLLPCGVVCNVVYALFFDVVVIYDVKYGILLFRLIICSFILLVCGVM